MRDPEKSQHSQRNGNEKLSVKYLCRAEDEGGKEGRVRARARKVFCILLCRTWRAEWEGSVRHVVG